ncbi:glycosyltransferase family 39 protein [Streptomyces varsoviensis]|uniref:glycosyltransferase family 39 protein n=1 Tax=Streptomyces varsoviensis TaxID=67373 RepID=UPI0033DCB4E8
MSSSDASARNAAPEHHAPRAPDSTPHASPATGRPPARPAGQPAVRPLARPFARLLVPAVPALLSLALGLWGLGREHSMWRDEAATWQVANRSAADIVRLLGTTDVVHGLYYLFMHALFEIFGGTLLTLRLPSVLGVVAATALTAATGRRLAGNWAGLSAGLAFTVLPVVQRYQQEGRSYALVTACVAGAAWMLVTALQRNRRRYWWGCAALLLTAGLLNWFSLLALPAFAVTVAIAARRGARRTARAWALPLAVVVLGSLPLILASRSQADQVSWIKPPTPATLIGLLAMAVVAVAAAFLPHPRSGPASTASVALPLLLVPQSALVLISLVKPVYVDRYVVFAQIGAALMIGLILGVGATAAHARWPLVRPWAPIAAVCGAAVLALLPVETGLRAPASRVDDVFAPAEVVSAVSRPGDGVLFLPAARRDTALVSPARFDGLKDLALTESPLQSRTLKGEEGSPAHIRSAILKSSRIVLITDAKPASGAARRDAAKRDTLADHFVRSSDTVVRGRRVEVYEKKQPAGRPVGG